MTIPRQSDYPHTAVAVDFARYKSDLEQNVHDEDEATWTDVVLFTAMGAILVGAAAYIGYQNNPEFARFLDEKGITQLAVDSREFFLEKANAGIEAGIALAGQAQEKMTEMYNGLREQHTETFAQAEEYAQFAQDQAGKLYTGAGEYANQAKEYVTTNAPLAWEAAKGYAADAKTYVETNGPVAWEAVQNFASEKMQDVQNFFRSFNLADTVSELREKFPGCGVICSSSYFRPHCTVDCT